METEIKERSTDKIEIQRSLTVVERDKKQLASLTWMDEFMFDMKRDILKMEFHAPDLNKATIVCHNVIHVDAENLVYEFRIQFNAREMLMADIETIEYQVNQDRGILEDIRLRGGNYTLDGLTGQIDEACLERDYLCKKMREMLEGK